MQGTCNNLLHTAHFPWLFKHITDYFQQLGVCANARAVLSQSIGLLSKSLDPSCTQKAATAGQCPFHQIFQHICGVCVLEAETILHLSLQQIFNFFSLLASSSNFWEHTGSWICCAVASRIVGQFGISILVRKVCVGEPKTKRPKCIRQTIIKDFSE